MNYQSIKAIPLITLGVALLFFISCESKPAPLALFWLPSAIG